MSSTPLVIHTDSLTIVSQFSELLLADKVLLEWTHANWWGFLLNLVHQRRGLHDSPLQLLWCPAHLLEHFPSPMLTDEEATRAGSSKQDIVLNRLADHFAKQQIHDTAQAVKGDLTCKEADVFARQLWLARCIGFAKSPQRLVKLWMLFPLRRRFSTRPDRCFQDGLGMSLLRSTCGKHKFRLTCRSVRVTNSLMQTFVFF